MPKAITHEQRLLDCDELLCDFLDELCSRIISAARRAKAVWCIFDNTASGSAIPNVLGLVRRVAELVTG